MRMLIVFLCCLTLSLPLAAQSVNHWETVVYAEDNWKYFPGTSDPGATWKTPAFNDAGWSTGTGGFGYGDGDDPTTIAAAMSVFLRKKFTITDLDQIEKLMLHVDYDDGFVAYINGLEITRSNIAGSTITYDQPSAGLHEAVMYQGGVPEGFVFEKNELSAWLVEGENTLAIEVHNDNINSSDLSAIVFLSVGLNTTDEVYGPVPNWFPQEFASSNLPIIVINTNGLPIVDEPHVIADMGVIDNGPGVRNNLSDPFNTYEGKIAIEIRGESSQMFPKKSYRVETRDNSGNNLNVALLGMPADNDWVLYAPYTDKTMMRDVLTYKLGRDMGRYAPRTRYAELVINGEYKGVYVLIEKIKRDKNRVNIAELTPQDVTGDELTGGYVLRVDKIDGNDYPAWVSVPAPKLAGERDINFQYFDPEGQDMMPVQQDYIRNFIKQVGSTLSSTNFATANLYEQLIDVPSFIDFVLVNEIGKNVDAYVFSTYLYKDKDSKGGLLHMGPLWDFNLAYGNVDYWTNSQFAPGWMYNDQQRMYWFRRLLQDPDFANKMKCRWKTLREGLLHDVYFNNAIDSMATLLNEAQQRNYQRWPILGTYVWPNQYIGATYADELTWMKQWIQTRITWMDSNMPGICTNVVTSAEDPVGKDDYVVSPNPASGTFIVRTEKNPDEASVIVSNIMGATIITGKVNHEMILDRTFVMPGIYIVRVVKGNTVLAVKKLVVN